MITLGKAEGYYKNRKDSAKSGRVGSYVKSIVLSARSSKVQLILGL